MECSPASNHQRARGGIFFGCHQKQTSAACQCQLSVSLQLSSALTSVGVSQLGPAQEAQVSGPSPHCLRVPEAQPGAEVVRLQRLVAIDGEVSTGVVAAVHPDLHSQPQPGHLESADETPESVQICVSSLEVASVLTSPRCDSPMGPLVSGLAMMMRTPGRICRDRRVRVNTGVAQQSRSETRRLTFPDSISGRL